MSGVDVTTLAPWPSRVRPPHIDKLSEATVSLLPVRHGISQGFTQIVVCTGSQVPGFIPRRW